MDGREKLSRAHAGDVPQGIFEHALLDRDLRQRFEVLKAATATHAEMRAGRRHPFVARLDQSCHARKRVIRFVAVYLDGNAFTDQRAFDEHCLAVDARDAPSFLVERGDDDGIHDGSCSTKAPRERSRSANKGLYRMPKRRIGSCPRASARICQPAGRVEFERCKFLRSIPRPRFAPSHWAMA